MTSNAKSAFTATAIALGIYDFQRTYKWLSDNYTCISAEQESGKLFFCSAVATCAGENAGGVRVQATGS